MEIGRRIYYEKTSGNVVLDTGEKSGAVVPTTVEQDILLYADLSIYNKEALDILELTYGQYAQEFARCSSYKINITTKEIEFDYTEKEQTYVKTLEDKVVDLEIAQVVTDTTLLELMESLLK